MDFRLLVKAPDDSDQSSFTLEGSKWTLSPSYDLDNDPEIPPFVCVSYRWGLEREPHALKPGLVMSTRTLPSLAAVIRSTGGKHGAFWTDVFCVPSDEGPQRQATLENMGYIYSRADKVVVVLSEATLATLQGMAKHGHNDEDSLRILEQDDWAASIWTHQELMNGVDVTFTSESRAGSGTEDATMECMQFLDAIGYSLSKWQKLTGSNNMDTARQFPNISLLEDLFAAYQTGSFILRSAFTIFSGVACKHNSDVENYFYAILGTLTSSSKQLDWRSDSNLADKIMRICEQKNDFSYIYTVADRDTDSQQRWRPRATLAVCDDSNIPVVLRPIILWHSWGDAQYGNRDPSGLWLHGMSVMQPSTTLQDIGKTAICSWLQRPDLGEASTRDLENAVYDALVFVGFRGARKPLVSPDGFVFTTESVKPETVVNALISHQIRWTMGAPGLVTIRDGNGEKRYVVCAFIGSTAGLLDDGETVLLE